MGNVNYMLLILMLLPLVGAAAIAFTRGEKHASSIAIVTTLATFVLSLAVLFGFDNTKTAEFQYAGAIDWVADFGLRFSFGVDAISIWLVMLTTFLMPLVIIGSLTAVKERLKEFFGWLLVLQAFMIGVFIARDLIFFYVCFEFTLVPMYFLIGIFGSTQRLKAARVFFLYTFTGSMLTFAGVIYVAWWAAQQGNAWSFEIDQLVLAAGSMSATQQTWVLLAMLAGFAVKVPIFPVHTWLPLAHTEAPTAGSVVLAGVLLKLGTYALLRLAIPMAPVAAVQLAPAIATLAIIGILYTALICWVQKDIKKLIAYSSVSHLGFCVLGLFALNKIGMAGAVMYMINHGLSTGALFLCVGMIYERFHTREFRHMGGLAKVMPIWSTFMVFFCLASVGLPGLNGFIGEFLTLVGAFTARGVLGPGYAAVAGIGMIFGAMYILYMVGRVVWGPLKVPAVHHDGDSHGAGGNAGHDSHGGHSPVNDLSMREIGVLIPLAVGCLVLGLYPAPILRPIEEPLGRIVAGTDAVQSRLVAAGESPVVASDNVVATPAASAAHVVTDAPAVHDATDASTAFVTVGDDRETMDYPARSTGVSELVESF